MSIAVSSTGLPKRNTAGKYFEVTRLITFTSYAGSGGDAVAASQFGLHRIRQARAQIVDGFAAGYAHVDALPQTDGSLLLRLRAAAGTESASGAGSAAVTARVIVQGY
jgi:hypothetical protein